jgi:hypothetical protein
MPKPHEYCVTERRTARGHLAAMVRTRPAGDPAIDRARRRFHAIKAKGTLLSALDELKTGAADMGEAIQFCTTAIAELDRALGRPAS